MKKKRECKSFKLKSFKFNFYGKKAFSTLNKDLDEKKIKNKKRFKKFQKMQKN